MLEYPIRDRRNERHVATRSEILDAAWHLVRKVGLAGLSLRDLARMVGMQAPSLYSYFDSKNAIYDAMFAQGASDYLVRESMVPSMDEPLAELRTALHMFVGFCTEDPVRYQLMFQRTIPGFEPSAETFAISMEGLERLRRRLARLGLKDNRSLDLFTAIGTGLTDQQISNDPGGHRWTSLVDDAVDMYFAYITKPKARSRRK